MELYAQIQLQRQTRGVAETGGSDLSVGNRVLFARGQKMIAVDCRRYRAAEVVTGTTLRVVAQIS